MKIVVKLLALTLLLTLTIASLRSTGIKGVAAGTDCCESSKVRMMEKIPVEGGRRRWPHNPA